MKKFKKAVVLVLAGLLTMSFAACGSSSASKYAEENGYSAASTETAYADSDYGYYAEETEAEVTNGSDTATQTEVDDSARKLIKNYDLNVETYDFDGFLSMIEDKVTSLGGYIESMNEYARSYYDDSAYRYSSLTIRIPKDKADEFVNLVGENANITNKSLSVQDVTLTYVDLESRKEAYEAEEERLLELLDQAQTMDDILSIEDKLTEVRYNLESMESQLRTYDNLVDYSTIDLYVDEVKEYTEPEPENFWSKLANSFTDGLEGTLGGLSDFLIGFVGAIPALVVLAIVTVIIILIVKACRKKHQKKLYEKQQAAYNAAQPMPQAPMGTFENTEHKDLTNGQ